MTAHFALFETPLGACGIAWRGDSVFATQLPEKDAATTADRLAKRAGATQSDPPDSIRSAIDLVTALLDGAGTDLTGIDCDLSGVEPFESKVYAITREIPPGKTRTYGDIATQLGDRLLAQRVGRAMGHNPLPIIVPCHRVIGANGKLTGFSAHGGVDTKLRMLAIEGAQFGDAPGLFDDIPLDVTPQR